MQIKSYRLILLRYSPKVVYLCVQRKIEGGLTPILSRKVFYKAKTAHKVTKEKALWLLSKPAKKQ